MIMNSRGNESSDFNRPSGKPNANDAKNSGDIHSEEQIERFLAELVMRLDEDGPVTIAEMADKFAEAGDLEKAERLSRKSIEIAEAQKQEPTWLCIFYIQLAVFLRRQKKLDEAEQWLLRAHGLADGEPLRSQRSLDVACEMTTVLKEQGRFAEAAGWNRKVRILLENIREKWERKERGLLE